MLSPYEMLSPQDIFRIADLERQHLMREYTFSEKEELQLLYLHRWLYDKLTIAKVVKELKTTPPKPKKVA